MHSRLLVGLSGLAGSGKSQASKFISNTYGIPRRPFAFPLKCMIGALGIPSEVLDGPAAVKELPTARLGGKTVRYALQTLGTEWGRTYMGEDFWVQQWRLGLDPIGCVADDCRFRNEWKAIKDEGGIVIRIERAGAGVSGTGAMHASEAIGAVPYDVLLTNNGTLADLHDGLARVIDELTGFKVVQPSLDLPQAGSFA